MSVTGQNVKDKSVYVAHREPHKQSGNVSSVEEKVLDSVRKEKAGGPLQTTPSQTPANIEPTQLRQRTGTWAEKRGESCSIF